MLPVVRVRVGQESKHRILSFGTPLVHDGVVPAEYKFQCVYEDSSDAGTEFGVVTVGFLASIDLNEHSIFLSTREGSAGPEYQVCFPDQWTVLSSWSEDIDSLWIDSLQKLESEGPSDVYISEDTLQFLDADPLFLFGLADPVTQRAIEKVSSTNVPMLKCLGTRPSLSEWFSYLNADIEADRAFSWVVEAFSESDLPSPWSSYKGVGSVVCYLNSETSETTWKHPFYDYFAQLLVHCRKSSSEEHAKLRINRLLWSYESEASSDLLSQQPLISPKYLLRMADIFAVDIISESFLVRTLKTSLKAFAIQYRLEDELDVKEVNCCFKMISEERTRRLEANRQSDHVNVSRQIYCVECGAIGALICPTCNDSFCQECFDRLHAKGNRSRHRGNHLIPCAICGVLPGRLQCTYSFGCYCLECYAQHAQTLPRYLDLRPIKIDYSKDFSRVRAAESKTLLSNEVVTAIGGVAYTEAEGRILAPGENNPKEELAKGSSCSVEVETVVGEVWHAFFDMRGVRYFYNFKTQESMRRAPNSVYSKTTFGTNFGLNKHESLAWLAGQRGPRFLGSDIVRRELLEELEGRR